MSTMNRTVHCLILGTALSGLSFTVGCEDEAAQLRIEAQQVIRSASVDFQKATAGSVDISDEAFATRQRELEALAGRLANVRGAEPGQQAAASLLAAETLTQLASMRVAKIEHLTQDFAEERDLARGRVSNFVRLDARADAQAALSTERERRELQQERQAAEEALDDLRRRLAALDEPIQDRTRRNHDDGAEAERLRLEANDLLRSAIELGHARGFPNFQEAIRIRRDADEIDYDVALREIELEYELLPEHRLAEVRADHARLTVEAVEHTLASFDQFDQAFEDDLRSTQQQMASIRDELSRSISTLHDLLDQVLAEHYDEAQSLLERAGGQTRQAVGQLRGEHGNPARYAQAKIHELQGQLAWKRLRTVSDLREIISATIDADDAAGDVAAYRRMLDDLNAEAAQLAEEATSAFEQAEQALAGITGRAAADAEQFREGVQRAAESVGRTE